MNRTQLDGDGMQSIPDRCRRPSDLAFRLDTPPSSAVTAAREPCGRAPSFLSAVCRSRVLVPSVCATLRLPEDGRDVVQLFAVRAPRDHAEQRVAGRGEYAASPRFLPRCPPARQSARGAGSDARRRGASSRPRTLGALSRPFLTATTIT